MIGGRRERNRRNPPPQWPIEHLLYLPQREIRRLERYVALPREIVAGLVIQDVSQEDLVRSDDANVRAMQRAPIELQGPVGSGDDAVSGVSVATSLLALRERGRDRARHRLPERGRLAVRDEQTLLDPRGVDLRCGAGVDALGVAAKAVPTPVRLRPHRDRLRAPEEIPVLRVEPRARALDAGYSNVR